MLPELWPALGGVTAVRVAFHALSVLISASYCIRLRTGEIIVSTYGAVDNGKE
jgi:hypothetical protein